MQLTDAEIRRILRVSAAEASLVTARLKPGSLRSTQIALAQVMTNLWGGVRSATAVGIGDGVYSALEYQALFDESLFKAARLSSSYWSASLLATAQQGAQALISRKENSITLSQRVWYNNQRSRTALNDTINSGLALGKTAAEIARDVKKFIQPDVPGGASYAAMRLGRSEVLNAYHQTAVRKYQETPWIEFVIWNLSGSHPRPDECNEFADNVFRAGMPSGSWRVNEVPDKPHPNCLCFITPEAVSLDKYAKDFKAGRYDDYIDKQMGCSRV